MPSPSIDFILPSPPQGLMPGLPRRDIAARPGPPGDARAGMAGPLEAHLQCRARPWEIKRYRACMLPGRSSPSGRACAKVVIPNSYVCVLTLGGIPSPSRARVLAVRARTSLTHATSEVHIGRR